MLSFFFLEINKIFLNSAFLAVIQRDWKLAGAKQKSSWKADFLSASLFLKEVKGMSSEFLLKNAVEKQLSGKVANRERKVFIKKNPQIWDF